MSSEGFDVVVINTTGAIGDTVAFSAVHAALTETGRKVGVTPVNFAYSLLHGLPNLLPQDEYDQARRVDISNYLSQFPHTSQLRNGRFGHLSEWMGKLTGEQMGIDLGVSRDEVKITLAPDEIANGQARLRSEKPTVMICPVSTTKNRNLSFSQVQALIDGLSSFSRPVLLEPVPEQYKRLNGVTTIGDNGLRDAASLLLAADAVITVDSASLHLVGGAIQGNPNNFNADPRKVVAVLGSSHPDVVCYRGNQVVRVTNTICSVAPCGAHGYLPLVGYGEVFKKSFYPSNLEGDDSGCVLSDYSTDETAACMMALSMNDIVNNMREYIENK